LIAFITFQNKRKSVKLYGKEQCAFYVRSSIQINYLSNSRTRSQAWRDSSKVTRDTSEINENNINTTNAETNDSKP